MCDFVLVLFVLVFFFFALGLVLVPMLLFLCYNSCVLGSYVVVLVAVAVS